MSESQPSGRSHLFLVRLWLGQEDSVSAGESLSHGKVQHLISGKACHFSDWPSLIDLLSAMATTSPAPHDVSIAHRSNLPHDTSENASGADDQSDPHLS